MTRTIVFAPDSFKGTISAADAAEALRAGWESVSPHDIAVLRPMADGGEGTVEAFAAAVTGARRMPVTVVGPHDEPTDASWLLLPPTHDAPAGTAVVELGTTSGIELLGTPPRLRPLDAHTAGFGQAIAAALDHGVSRLVLGIGSSASTDGGTGLLTALGARFTDAGGRAIAPGARGLAELAAADLSGLRALPDGGAIVLTDVTNPLVGTLGSAAVFGPQKGLAPGDIAPVDADLSRLAALLGADPAHPGSGAAGGAGLALRVWGGELVPGAEAVAELIGLRAAVAAASVVVTGEGSFDGQSAAGKVPAFVAGLAASTAREFVRFTVDGTPVTQRGAGRAGASSGPRVALVAGRITTDADTTAFAAVVSLSALAGSPAAAMAEPAAWLRAAGAALARSPA